MGLSSDFLFIGSVEEFLENLGTVMVLLHRKPSLNDLYVLL